ncbi:MAG: 50S ribosomal protein L4 [bacterium]|nr:50S ribosomal protein L4 [bacterium]
MSLREDIFAIPPNKKLLHEKVVAQLANRRRGTAATKTRAFVSGGGAKPWRQKGTGRARVGSNRSPLWVGGAVIFGPQPRSYKQSFNKKKTQAALKSAFATRMQDGAIIVLDKLELAEIKTKQIAELLKTFKVNGSALFTTVNADPKVEKSIRNLANTKLITTNNINVLDLLKYDTLIFSKDAFEEIQKRFGAPA